MIKVLIVDDSKFMRLNLEKLLSEDERFNIVASKRNGIEALEFLKNHSVDVIILDLFMPKLDGLQTLTRIMETNPIPTILITTVNKQENAEKYFAALKLGAFDIVSKPSGLNSLYVEQMIELLKDRIYFASKTKHKLKKITSIEKPDKIKSFEKKNIIFENIVEKNQLINEEYEKYQPSHKLIVLGASTGGPPKIIEILKKIQPSRKFSMIIVQHIPEGFSAYFADRLNKICDLKVKEVSNGDTLKQGEIYVAPGDYHLKMIPKNGEIILLLNREKKIWGLRPSIDYTMLSAAPLYKKKCYGIILTGMGQDGAFGIKKIKAYGGTTIIQDPNEAIIASMPMKAYETGAIDHIMNVSNIADYINRISV